MGKQKKTGAELKKKKKDLLGQKLGKKLSIRDKKWPIFKKNKKNKGLFGSKKNKLGLSLRWKKTFFGPKIGKKLSIRTKFDQFFPKKDSLGQKLWKKWSSSVKNWQISPQKLSFGARIGKQLRIQAKKIDQFEKKK